MRNIYRAGLLLTIMLLIAACGTVATPRYEADRIIAEAQAEATHIIETAQAQGVITDETTEEVEAVTVEPTEGPTEVPSTEVPTQEPTEVPTEVPPTEVPTEVPTEIPSTEIPTEDHSAGEHGDMEMSEREAEIEAAVDTADAQSGEISFLTIGCGACHTTTEVQIIGPGLAGVFNRAGEHADHRPEGQGAYEYVFTSIRNSQAFVVEGFAPNLMPIYTEAQLSDQDIYNIMAYLRQFSDLPE